MCPPEWRRQQLGGAKTGIEGGVEGGKVHALTHATSETSVRRRTTERAWIGVRERESENGKATRATVPAQHRLTTALPDHPVDWQLCC